MGDVAMLQVAVSRISELWPNALIEVVTEVPELLSLYCPNARPLTARGSEVWFQAAGSYLGASFIGLYLVPLFSSRHGIGKRSTVTLAVVGARHDSLPWSKLRPTDGVELGNVFGCPIVGRSGHHERLWRHQ